MCNKTASASFMHPSLALLQSMHHRIHSQISTSFHSKAFRHEYCTTPKREVGHMGTHTQRSPVLTSLYCPCNDGPRLGHTFFPAGHKRPHFLRQYTVYLFVIVYVCVANFSFVEEKQARQRKPFIFLPFCIVNFFGFINVFLSS